MAYKAQEYKDHALRELLDDLHRQSKMPTDTSPVDYKRDLGRAKAIADAAQRLQAILDTPVAEPAPTEPVPGELQLWFQGEDMAVVVVTPEGVLGKGMPRTLFFDETSQETVATTLTPLTKAIVGAMLDHAREQLDA
jgi:hypothetical protein